MNENMCKPMDIGPDLDLFDSWVRKNYGGNSRTKTVTREKYMKICALLRGEQTNSNAKFRFWVRSKGFRLLRHDCVTDEIVDDLNGQLYVSLHAKEESTPMIEGSIENFLRTNLPAISFFRKVAIVDEFYNIIKVAHIDEKGKHAGQKKTYRLVSDTYAFLPREVITFYLLNCDTCKPRIQKYGPIQAKNRRNMASNGLKSTSPKAVRNSPTSKSLVKEDHPKCFVSTECTSPVNTASPVITRASPLFKAPSSSPQHSLSVFQPSLNRYKIFDDRRPSLVLNDDPEDEYIDPVGHYNHLETASSFSGSTSPNSLSGYSQPPALVPKQKYIEESYKSKYPTSEKLYKHRYDPYGTSTRDHLYKQRETANLTSHIDGRPYDFATTYIEKHYQYHGLKPGKELLQYSTYAKPTVDRCINSHTYDERLEQCQSDRYLLKQRDVMLYQQKRYYSKFPPSLEENYARVSYRENIPVRRDEYPRQVLREEHKLKPLHDLMYSPEVINIHKQEYDRRSLRMPSRLPQIVHY